ncbi:unnamed protein product [Hydatigera taeniaeformis]|uniref:dolichyl-P-Man:Man5GlcNAc2-PP-dolichol alpha-1,3-mannosyltransferase n=1 Tax=Hydatigena taeniaeformis TaxID=6205 RepID=A0A0R3XCG8_HYDTA|nr:unnamed protein product [Hydatigera taeniaeformis]
MQQSEHFLNGTRDYDQLIGRTGPCVYPAMHIYIYSLLYYLTDHGRNIFAAQCFFAVLYAITMILIYNIYWKLQKVPLLPILILSFTSYRVHSIYLLRLFNDPWAMFFLYSSINWCLYNHFSCAALFIILTSLLFTTCAYVLLGAIFLFRNSEAYFTHAFDFSRQFMYKWTVNWRIIPESLFLDRRFHVTLLSLHLLLLSFFLIKFISRSLHYQFYVWYYHSIPFILWSVPLLSDPMSWNVYPSTVLSSATLHVCHAIIVLGLALQPLCTASVPPRRLKVAHSPLYYGHFIFCFSLFS